MKRSLLVALVAVMFMSVSAHGQYYADGSTSFESFFLSFDGGGARAEGMGGAFLAVSDDVTSIGWNPAGIYELETTVVGLTYSSLAPRGSATTNVFTGTRGIFAYDFDHSGFLGSVSSLNFAAPIRISGHPFVGSVSFVKNYDEFQQYSISAEEDVPMVVLNDAGVLVLDTLLATIDGNFELTGGLKSLNLGIGTRIYNNISVGLSTNVYTGKTVRRDTRRIHADSVTVQYFQRATAVLDTLFIDSNKFSGVNFTLGLKLNGEKLDAGLVVRTPFTLSIKKGSAMYSQMTLNGSVFGENTDTIFVDNQLIKYDMPLMIGGGVAYHFSDRLLGAFDIEYRGYSSTRIMDRYQIIVDPGANDQEFYNEYDPDWNNVFLFHAGAEYLMERSFGTIPLRIGFGYEQIPMPSLEGRIDTLGVPYVAKSTSAAKSLSLGTGLQWNQIHLECGYTYTMLNHHMNAGGFWSSELKNRNHHLTFSFTGFF